MGKRGMRIDLTGQKFGRLTVVEHVETVNRITTWRCKCDCGNEIISTTSRLRTGHTRSCGCLAAEYRRNKPEAVRLSAIANTTHGCSKDRLFKIWASMRSRCNSPTNPAYRWYGAKGVKICEEWNYYPNFKQWAYANGYDDTAKTHACSIDRIDSMGDYSPENCRWADVKTQNENKSCVVVYSYNGETGTLGYFARKYGFKECTLRWRVKKLNWPIEKALTTQPWRK